MSKDTNEILGHAAESDGIEEYDNPLPDWWLGLFFLTAVYGVGYGIHFHFIAGHSQASLYDSEVAAAKLQWPELTAKAVADASPESLKLGEEMFTANCVSCHKADLSGGIGPNLKDTEWLHGGEFDDIVNTISDGVLAKGMPQWGPILGPKKVAALSSYILSKNTGEAPAAASDEPVAAGTQAAGMTGEAVFTTNCVACHGTDLKGGVGPDLTDDEWIHGGTIDDLVKTITNGVPAKGMVSWKGILEEAQIDAVANYIFEYNQ